MTLERVTKNYYSIIQGEIQMKYVCNVCGWIYDEEEQGKKWDELPDDFVCEVCGVGKDDFTAQE
jgi:rubredoxin